MGHDCGRTQDDGGQVGSAPVAAARQAWIFFCADYRLDPQELPGLNRESDPDRTQWLRTFGACAVKG